MRRHIQLSCPCLCTLQRGRAGMGSTASRGCCLFVRPSIAVGLAPTRLAPVMGAQSPPHKQHRTRPRTHRPISGPWLTCSRLPCVASYLPMGVGRVKCVSERRIQTQSHPINSMRERGPVCLVRPRPPCSFSHDRIPFPPTTVSTVAVEQDAQPQGTLLDI